MIKKHLFRFYVWLKYNLFFEDFCIIIFYVAAFVLLLLATSCRSHQHLTDETVIRYKDSTIINYKDSLIRVEVPVEKIVNIVALPDTLKLETSLATASAWIDTTSTPNTLRGTLENKNNAVLEKIVYLPSELKVIYRDSIQTKEVPVEVEKIKTKTPKFIIWLLGIMGTLLLVAYRKYIAKGLKFLMALI